MNNLTDRLDLIYKERPDLEGDRGQTGLVKASGASKSVVNQWLQGEIKSMNLKYALEIERALGYSHIWLVLGEGSPKVDGGSISPVLQAAAPPSHTQWIGDKEARLLDLYRTTDDRGREKIMRTAEGAPRSPRALLVEVTNNKP